MALYIPQSIFHLAWLLYVRPENFGPYYVYIGVSFFYVTDYFFSSVRYLASVLGAWQRREMLTEF